MCMTNAVVNSQTNHLEHKTVHTGYIVDEQGREVQITTNMIRSVCHDLLKQCRTIKN